MIVNSILQLTSEETKKVYLPILEHIVTSPDSDKKQTEIHKIKESLENKGKYDSLPDLELTKEEIKRLIPYLTKKISQEGGLYYLGIEVQERVEKEEEASPRRTETAPIKNDPDANSTYTYKLNIKKFLLNYINENLNMSKMNLEDKVNLIWQQYDMNKDGVIEETEMRAMLNNFNHSNFLYFDKTTINEIAEIIFEKMDKEGKRYITKDEFMNHLLLIKQTDPSNPLALNLFQEEKVKKEKKEEVEADKFAGKIVSKYAAFFLMNIKSIIWLVIYVLTNIFFGVYFFILAYKPEVVALAFARLFAGVILWNMALLLFFVCENFLTFFSRTWLYTILPLNNITFYHKICARVFIVSSIGHVFSHLVGTFLYFSSNDLATVNKLLYTKLIVHPSYFFLLFQTISGLTGLILIFAIALIFSNSIKAVITKNFELFWYSHKLFYIVFLATYLHGLGKLIGLPSFYKFFAGPGILFFFELVIDVVRFFLYKVKIISVKLVDTDVVELVVKKPKKCFQNKPGQYVRINIPEISLLQYHPFTISSASHHPNLVFYISPFGDWTKKLAKVAKHFKLNSAITIKNTLDALNVNPTRNFTMRNKKTNYLFYEPKAIENVMIRPHCRLDGPLGAPCERYEKYKDLIFIAGGIGITPFSSILYSFLNDFKNTEECPYESVHLVWVVRKFTSAKWMIHLIKRVLSESDININKVFSVSLYVTNTQDKNDLGCFFLWHGLDLLKKERREKISNYCESIYWGRPKWEDVLLKKRESILLNNEANENVKKDIGLFVCANGNICRDVYIACRKHSGEGIYFNFHKENF